jgi:hypothetical protein
VAATAAWVDNLRAIINANGAITRRADLSFGAPYNGMTQTSPAIIVAIKPSMEYATLCMSMRLGNVRYSA